MTYVDPLIPKVGISWHTWKELSPSQVSSELFDGPELSHSWPKCLPQSGLLLHRSLSQNHTHTWERPAPPLLPAQQPTSIKDSLVNQKEKVVSWSLPRHTHLEHSCLLFGFLPFLSLSCVPQLRVEMASSLLISTPPVLQSSFVHSHVCSSIDWFIQHDPKFLHS